jgi:hypothetical protein
VNRCVDPSLLVRLETSRDTSLEFANKQAVFNTLVTKLNVRPITFW